MSPPLVILNLLLCDVVEAPFPALRCLPPYGECIPEHVPEQGKYTLHPGLACLWFLFCCPSALFELFVVLVLLPKFVRRVYAFIIIVIRLKQSQVIRLQLRGHAVVHHGHHVSEKTTLGSWCLSSAEFILLFPVSLKVLTQVVVGVQCLHHISVVIKCFVVCEDLYARLFEVRIRVD